VALAEEEEFNHGVHGEEGGIKKNLGLSQFAGLNADNL
jgi:hypothetical protein